MKPWLGMAGAGLILMTGLTVPLRAEVPRGPVEMTVRTWRPEDGLPDRTVTAVLQTRDGYLWVGTPKGLVRFDGVRFVPVDLAGAEGSAPRAVPVTVLCEDGLGRLWVGTQGEGLWCQEAQQWRRVSLPPDGPGVTIHTVTAAPDGTLWVGTSAGLVQWREGRSRWFTRSDGLPHETIIQVSAARNGELWITTAGGICRWSEGQIQPFRFEAESVGRSPEFLGVYEDRRGNLWAFGDTYLVNLTEGKRVNYFRSGDVAAVRIWTLWEGRDGRLWIGTSGQGLFYFSGERFLPLTLRSGSLPNDVRALCEDQAGNLWLGTGNSGLVCLRPTQASLQGVEAGLPPGPATLVATDPAGRLWVGVEGQGLWVRSGDLFQAPGGAWRASVKGVISALAFDGADRLWVATAGAGLYEVRGNRAVRHGSAEGLRTEDVGALAVDGEGWLWVAPRSGGLQRWRPGQTADVGEWEALAGETVTVLVATSNVVWAGTAQGRVWKRDSDRWREVGSAELRSVGAVRALHPDAQGRLWVGGDRGLACGVGARWWVWRWEEAGAAPVRGLTTDDRGAVWWTSGTAVWNWPAARVRQLLKGGEPVRPRLWYAGSGSAETPLRWGWPRVARTGDGRLWFATESGLVSVRGDASGEAPPAPPVWIESLLVNGHPLPGSKMGRGGQRGAAAEPVRLGAGLASLEIQFTAPVPAEGDRVRFRHRLENFDPDWVDSGPDRRARYGRLPGGFYRFQVKAFSADGSWESPLTELALVVPTPFWRSAWGITLWAVMLAGIVAGVVRWVSHQRLRRQLEHLAQQEAMYRERMRIARNMHDELGSKLTRISFLSERALLEMDGRHGAAQKLEAIASTARAMLQTLDEIVWAVNPSNDSLEHLISYLAQYAAEYFQGTQTECQLRLPRQVPAVPLTAEVRHQVFLACEEALHNVLKHAGARRVLVEMQARDGLFSIRIQDDGQGFDERRPVGPGQDGLANMHQRLAEIGGTCRVRSHPGQGTVVEFCFPLPKEKA
ncbi:two-component regulator propeller domain-containing protein [Limisphaera sp. VF-2]|jgi:signal transduction histidine kinase/ligand-binding sensor domain-containing protein|uniref:sensor histidine kinase n=1 Tax=Limisphaera sp. VF-2 TaxID=3400418 RepID=UPI001750B52C